MKRATPLLIAILICALPAPVLAQQASPEADDAEIHVQSADTGRNHTGGRFMLDIAGHDTGLVSPIDKDQTATVRDPNAAAAVAATRPSVVGRPGTIVVAPVADDKDED